MISIDLIYQNIQGLLNKDQRGSLTPTEFNGFAATTLMDIIDHARITIKNDKLGVLIGKEAKERLEYSSRLLSFFYKPITITHSLGEYAKPTDIEEIEGIFYGDYKVELLDSFYHLTLLRGLGKHTSDEEGDSSANIYALELENGFKIYPSSFQEGLDMYYTRSPKMPKWTYTTISGTPIFNGSASDAQDVELPMKFLDDMVWGIAQMAGINIRDNAALQPIFAKQTQEELKEDAV